MSLEKQTDVTHSILPYHDTRFDWARDRAHSYVTENLGLTHSIGKERVAIVTDTDKADVARRMGIEEWKGGGYDPGIREAVVTATPDLTNPEGASHRLVSKTVHELVHSATEDDNNEHKYWSEQLAGIGEVLYLQELARQGQRLKVSDFVLKRAGVELLVPAAYRYYDSDTTQGANTTQGLVAATGFAVSREKSGHRGPEILLASAPGDRTHYGALKQSYDTLKPGLSREVESFPQTTEGIIQATSVVHEEGRKQNLIPPRR